MKMRNRIFILLTLCIIIFGFVFGINTKSTFKNDLGFQQENFGSLKFQSYFDRNHDFNELIDNFEELKKESPYIVLVKPTGERVKYSMALKTSVEVLDVYQDNEGKINKGDTIFIFEPCIITKNTLNSNSGYIPMKNNIEYIILLKDFIKLSSYNYKYFEEEKSFIPSSIFYGKFKLNEETKIIKDFENLTTEKMLDYDLAFFKDNINYEEFNYNSQDIINKYETIKRDLNYFIN